MTGINHALTGALLVSTISTPWLGLPVAFVSHFVLDMLPHFGNHPKFVHTSRAFHLLLSVDIVLIVSLFVFIGLTRVEQWPLLALGSMFAISPDLMWTPYFWATHNGRVRPHGPFSRFHKLIQRYERPWGYITEILWFVAMVSILATTVF